MADRQALAAALMAPEDQTAAGMIQRARMQLATQPQRMPTSYGNHDGDAAAMQPETFANPVVRQLLAHFLRMSQ